MRVNQLKFSDLRVGMIFKNSEENEKVVDILKKEYVVRHGDGELYNWPQGELETYHDDWIVDNFKTGNFITLYEKLTHSGGLSGEQGI